MTQINVNNLIPNYKVIATKEQLEELGISYEITGLIGKLEREYNTGYLGIAITHVVGTHTFTNLFDIPKEYLIKQ